jgi:hypothetical protein
MIAQSPKNPTRRAADGRGLAAVLLLCAAQAMADDSRDNYSFVTGNDLLDWCQSPVATRGKVFCAGYVEGIVDALGNNPINGFKACIPSKPGFNAGQAMDITINFLRANPEYRNYTADGLVAEAFAKAFPCRETR